MSKATRLSTPTWVPELELTNKMEMINSVNLSNFHWMHITHPKETNEKFKRVRDMEFAEALMYQQLVVARIQAESHERETAIKANQGLLDTCTPVKNNGESAYDLTIRTGQAERDREVSQLGGRDGSQDPSVP